MRQHALDLRLAADTGDGTHCAMQVDGGGQPAARLALAKAAVIDELDVETAKRGRRLEHLALDAAGAIPGRLAARRRIERENEPAAATARSCGRHPLQLVEERIDLGRGGFCREPVVIVTHVGLSQTEVSWNTAPPPGRPGSALVSTLMPISSAKARFGHNPSATMTRGCMPSKARACRTTLPCALPMRTRSPSLRPSAASAAGWIIAVGRLSRARLDGVLLKLVFRNE